MNPFLAEMYVAQRLAAAQPRYRPEDERTGRRRAVRARRLERFGWRVRRIPAPAVTR
jgi:hypothetical protein